MIREAAKHQTEQPIPPARIDMARGSRCGVVHERQHLVLSCVTRETGQTTHERPERHGWLGLGGVGGRGWVVG